MIGWNRGTDRLLFVLVADVAAAMLGVLRAEGIEGTLLQFGRRHAPQCAGRARPARYAPVLVRAAARGADGASLRRQLTECPPTAPTPARGG